MSGVDYRIKSVSLLLMLGLLCFKSLAMLVVLIHHCSAMFYLHLLDVGLQLLDSLFIVKVSVELIRPCIDELLEKSLPKEVEDRILAIIVSHQGVNSPHHLRTRRIGNNIAIEVHIRMDGAMSIKDAHDITKIIEKALKEEFGQNTHIGIHVEPWK